MNVMLAYKALAAVLAVVVAIAGMGGGVVLAADALPGDFLYPVKLLSEDVRLALTSGPSARAELGMAFVDLRVQEMTRLAQQGEEVRQAEVDRMTRQMEQVMVEIAKSQPEEAPALLSRLIERTRLHQQVLEDELTEMHTRLWEAVQLMERTRLNAENDPQYLEYQHQNRYQGEQGEQGEGEQTQEQNQNSYQGEQGAQGTGQQTQEQNQNSYQGEQGAQGDGQQIQEQTQEQAQEQTQEQTQEQSQHENQEQDQQQNQNSREGEQSPSSGSESQPNGSQQQGGNSSNGH
jgi:hypothetical protein